MLNVNDVNQIYLGCQGENLARTIVIDVKPWLVAHPNGVVTLYHKRNGSEEATPTGAEFDAEAGTLTWRPTSTDTYVFGEGEAEIRLAEGSVIKKSRKIKTDVAKAVTGGDGTDLESGWQGYLDAIEKAAQVAITKNGMIKFAVNSNGHLIFSYTDQVPVPADDDDSETTVGDITWIDKDLGTVSAFGVAKENGWTGTEALWTALQAACPELALKAESFGAGTRNGDNLVDGDPAYNNNAKYYAGQAAASATDAAGSADDAADSATAAAASAADALEHTQSTIETWLGNNIDPDSGYALDRTLSLQNAAAPADIVGGLKSAVKQSFEELCDISDVITNIRIVGNAPKGLVFNDVRNNYNNTTGFRIFTEGLVTDICTDLSLEANSSGSYEYFGSNYVILFDYDFSQLSSGSQKTSVTGYKISDWCYTNAIKPYMQIVDSVEGIHGSIYNIHIVGDVANGLVFNDIRNYYGSSHMTGLQLLSSDMSVSYIADFSFSENDKGSYKYVGDSFVITFDYDFSKVKSGTRVISQNGYAVPGKYYEKAATEYIKLQKSVDGTKGVISNLRVVGNVTHNLIFNEVRNNYSSLTGFQITYADRTNIVMAYSFQTNEKGFYEYAGDGFIITLEYDFSKVPSGTRINTANGIAFPESCYEKAVTDYINTVNVFDKRSVLSDCFTNVEIVSEKRIMITDVRNNKNGVTGFALCESDSTGAIVGTLNYSFGLQTQGSFVGKYDFGIITFDYDLSAITSGTSVTGIGLDHLFTKKCYIESLIGMLYGKKETVITVKTDGTGDYSNLRLALEYVKGLANENNPFVVELYEGTYTVNNYYTSEEWETESSSMIGLIVPNYCTLRGMGGRDNVIVTGSSEVKRQYISTINTSDTCSIENITFISNGLRYAIHDDYSNSSHHSKRVIKNCIFKHTNGYYAKAYGAGLHDDDEVILADCVFDSDVDNDYSISFHNNVNFTKGSTITLDNCRCNQKGIDFITTEEGELTSVMVKLTGVKADYVSLSRFIKDVPICVYVTGYANAVNHYISTYGNVEDYVDVI